MTNKKLNVQRTILAVGIILMVGKFAAYWITDSVGILTDAMESIVNVAAGMLGLWSLWLASRPRDESHPFGHGKVEMLTASAEAMMIVVAGAIIVYEGVGRILSPTMPERLDTGIIIVAVAGIANWLLGTWSIKVGQKTSSIALVSGGKHLQSDTYSTIGLIVGLAVLYITDIAWIDGALALVFGVIIVSTGIGILRQTMRLLMDHSDLKDIARVVEITNKQRHPSWIDIHDLRIISYGEVLHVDCHLTVPWYYTVRQGHEQCDALEEAIAKGLTPNITMVSVHSDPCDERLCQSCELNDCPQRNSWQSSRTIPLTTHTITQDDQARANRLESTK